MASPAEVWGILALLIPYPFNRERESNYSGCSTGSNAPPGTALETGEQ